jgi:hypothetical protein
MRELLTYSGCAHNLALEQIAERNKIKAFKNNDLAILFKSREESEKSG